MATAVLNWNAPGGSNSINQTVKYRLNGASSWTTFANVSASTATSTITGLSDNLIYEFQVINNCTVGGPSNSTSDFKIKIICPSVTTTPTYNSVAFSFAHVGGDISKYVVDLMNSDGTSILGTKTFVSPSGTISDTFTGLTGSTAYQLRVTIYAGTSFSFSKVCTNTSFSTSVTPTCSAPTAVVATLS